MAGERFHIVDVFAESPCTGNQLAVFPDAGHLSGTAMQTLALEMGYAESSFILGGEDADGAWPVRIFTPFEEVPFAGHPTLGTAFVIRTMLLDAPRDEVALAVKAGRIPVRFESDAADAPGFMRQRPPEFGATVPHEPLAAALGVEPADLDTDHPAQVVSTGIPFLIVPFRALDGVRRARLREERYDALVEAHGHPAVFLACPEAFDAGNQFHARMFAPRYGVPEDAATGSANGCFAGWLVRHRYRGAATVDARVEQGHAIRRPSLLSLRAREGDDGIEVEVGGRVHAIATGELTVDTADLS